MHMHEQEKVVVNQQWFKQHQATLIDAKTIVWRDPTSSFYYAYYHILQERHLVVLGDMGSALYRWSDPIDFEWLARQGLHYFHSKCTASDGGSCPKDWSKDRAREFVEEHRTEFGTFYQDALEARHLRSEWLHFLSVNQADLDEELFYLDQLSQAGDVISLMCAGHLQGLKEAIAQLQKQGKFA